MKRWAAVTVEASSDSRIAESAANARDRGWPVADIPGVQHLAMATDPIAVADALLELERALVRPA